MFFTHCMCFSLSLIDFSSGVLSNTCVSTMNRWKKAQIYHSKLVVQVQDEVTKHTAPGSWAQLWRTKGKNLSIVANLGYASRVLNKILKLFWNCGSGGVEQKRRWYANELLSGICLWHLGLTVMWIHAAVWNSVWENSSTRGRITHKHAPSLCLFLSRSLFCLLLFFVMNVTVNMGAAAKGREFWFASIPDRIWNDALVRCGINQPRHRHHRVFIYTIYYLLIALFSAVYDYLIHVSPFKQ